MAQPTLLSGASLARVAEILRFAAALGGGNNLVPRVSTNEGKSDPACPGPSELDFASAVSELFRILHDRHVRYILVGGVALLRYVSGRNTDDIDLLLAVEELKALPEIRWEEESDWFAKGRFGEVRVDMLFTSKPLFHIVQQKYSAGQKFLESEFQRRRIRTPLASAHQDG